MKNCIVAQSGGPSPVINASVFGVVEESTRSEYFNTVYAGINGIEGILQEKIISLSALPYSKLEMLKFTPSSGLGSCRYKMKNFETDDSEYIKLFTILEKLSIDTFFYVGGNDSMDTVNQLSKYAALHNKAVKFIGVPKTIDNDLPLTDHTPGFGSAAKVIATTTLETYLDSSVYENNGIFILETMGRDTGWLAASAALARINGKCVADFIYLPETPFVQEQFLQEVAQKFKEQNQVYIVASEGIKDPSGAFLAEIKSSGAHDTFGHAQLGGVCNFLKNLIVEKGITSRVKTLELGVIQRCAMHCASLTDIEEAQLAGNSAVKAAKKGMSGYMVALERKSDTPYTVGTILVPTEDVANKIKYFPKEWISKEGNHIEDAALTYLSPLIQENPALNLQQGLPEFIVLDKPTV